MNLKNNNISDLKPLVANTGLGVGDNVYITGNNSDLTEVTKDM
ncbi:MAG: hypothetical protein ACOC80_00450 [Petrotogales bacterium]